MPGNSSRNKPERVLVITVSHANADIVQVVCGNVTFLFPLKFTLPEEDRELIEM